MQVFKIKRGSAEGPAASRMEKSRPLQGSLPNSGSRQPWSRFSQEELQELENFFKSNRYPTYTEILDLATSLNRELDQVQLWFKNRQAKEAKLLKQSRLQGPEANTAPQDPGSWPPHPLPGPQPAPPLEPRPPPPPAPVPRPPPPFEPRPRPPPAPRPAPAGLVSLEYSEDPEFLEEPEDPEFCEDAEDPESWEDAEDKFLEDPEDSEFSEDPEFWEDP